MARKRYYPEEIIQHLRTAELEQSKVATQEDAARRIGVTPVTLSRWKSEFGGLRVDQAKRLKELEQGASSPWENGYCESFNGKMRYELLDGEIFYSLLEAKIIIERWRIHYNTKRPHSSLGGRPPAPETFRPNLMLLANDLLKQ